VKTKRQERNSNKEYKEEKPRKYDGMLKKEFGYGCISVFPICN
jgi:hypothetical protein